MWRFGLVLAFLMGLSSAAHAIEIDSWPAPFRDPVPVAAKFWEAPPGEAHPAPAVVLLHGCGGWYGDNVENWAKWFQARGFHALAIDSFESRGHPDGICASLATGAKVGILTRVEDAYGGLTWLTAREDVDPKRIVVMGFSNGGTTALTAVTKGNVPRDFPAGLRFAGSIPLYPWCGAAAQGTSLHTLAPVLIVIGAEDDWTPPRLCERAAGNLGSEHSFHVEIVPGAYHSFDMTAWRGRAVGSRIYLGHRLEPNAAATDTARRSVDAFLRELFPGSH